MKVYQQDHPTVRLEIAMPKFCGICREHPPDVFLPETATPGWSYLGDPNKLLGWCAACCPEWAMKKWIRLNDSTR